MAKIIMISGGARSGKSNFALKIANKSKRKKAFLATAIAFDEEMIKRIQKHKSERDENFETFEEAFEIKTILQEVNKKYTLCVIDCLTVYLGNLFYKYQNNQKIEDYIFNFIEAIKHFKGTIILVTNETGLGIVPDNKLARNFRDTLGSLNSKIASMSAKVYFCISGIPMKVKG